MHTPDRIIGAEPKPATPATPYDEMARREREQRFLADAGEALASSLDYRATLDSVAHMAAGSIADFCVVEILDAQGRLERVASEDVEDGHCDDLCAAVDGGRVDEGNWAVATALTEGKVLPVTVDELPHDAFGHALRTMGARSVIIAPLRVRERSIGVLVLGWRSDEHRYGDGEALLAAELARRAAIAIENARLHAEAQRAIQARDQTLAVVAHDLRNPLGVISMTAALVKELNSADPAVVGRMEAIERSTTQMNRLIQDLLDAARIDAGKLKLDIFPDRVGAILRELAETMQPLAQNAGLVFDLRVDEGLPLIMADRQRLIQALGNLVGNAIKFTPAGGKVVVAAEPAPGGVRIRVADNGAGMDATSLAHLFDRFWQQRPGDARGIGLGLAITKGIIEAHGATIEVRSELGVGTEFSFVLQESA